MSLEKIEKGLERENKIAEDQLINGLIDNEEYNQIIRENERDATEYAREEMQNPYEGYFHN